MPSLPTVTGPEAIRAFERLGFQEVRVRGSHHILKKPGNEYALSVPVHGNKPVASGTLRSLLRTAGVTIEQFTDALQS